MNFSTSSNPNRHPLLRAGLKGSTFATSFIVKSELVNLTNNNHVPPNNNTNFLTITKSRVPDIQMINKYYGLVPKKFVINARSDYSSTKSTKLRVRTAQSFDSELSEGLLEENLVTKNKIKDFAGGEEKEWKESATTIVLPGEEKNGSEVDELVARKMPVEKHKKWKRVKNCGRSLSMMEDCENMGSTTVGSVGGHHHHHNHHHHKDSKESRGDVDRMDIQRVIKIDLHNMRWEECYQDKSNKSDGGDTADEMSDHGNNYQPSSPGNNNNPAPTAPTPVKRGSLRKTISFDEQLVRSSVEGNSTSKSEKDTTRRPMTASCKATMTITTVTQPPSSAPPSSKISPWTQRTGLNTADRRSKFQKSVSIYQDSIDYNGESDTETDFPDVSPSSELKNRESKKSLHVQPLPEVSTMISLINPPPDDDLQLEIDKMASLIDNVQTKMTEVEAIKVSKEDDETSIPEPKPQETVDPIQDDPEEKEVGGEEEKVPEEKCPTPLPEKSEEILPPVESPMISSVKSRRPPLQKAASISCETELHIPISTPPGKVRPQTSKGKTSVSFSSTTTTRFIPSSRSPSLGTHTSHGLSKDAAGSAAPTPPENGLSQGLKNRKILIKKALIEINQSSINLGKKFSHVRPKTAPTPEKKSGSAGSSHTNHVPNKRQPMKARSPSIKMPVLTRKNSTLSSKMERQNSSKEPSPEPEPEPSPPKVRAVPRQSFSVSDGLLHKFGPDFSGEDDVNRDLEISFLNSKKREECLKIYEKMMKKGCHVKLETIFRGMMTPSEYRMFLKATELAEKNAAVEEDTGTSENINPKGDAGVSEIVET